MSSIDCSKLEEVRVPGTSHATLSDATRAWIAPYTIPPGLRDKPETHMSLAGGPYGRLSIPDEMHEAWLRIYTQELALNTHSLFFAERRTPVFRMHFDLDFTQEQPVDLHYLTAMARECIRVFRLFFPDVPEDAPMWRCVLLVAGPKPTKANAMDLVKSGCHMLWPWLYVNQIQALQLRANVVDTLNRTWPSRNSPANSYEDVVDRTVLTSNGLRMLGSDKAVRCKKCNKGAAREKCANCDGRGFLVENRAYTLAMILNSSGEPDRDRLEDWKKDLFTCVRFTSTRSSRREHSAGFVVPSHAVTDDAVKTAHRKAKKKSGSAGTVELPCEAVGLPGAVAIEPSSRIFTELHSFLTTCMCPQWAGVRMTNLYIQHELGRYTAHVNGPGSSFCQHVNRAHNSSVVRFTVERDGVRQRCFSPKLHEGVSCRMYAGPVTPLSCWLQEAMFGARVSAKVAIQPETSDESILAKSAAYKKTLAERVDAKRKKRIDEEKTLDALGKKRVKTKGDRGADVPHPIFTTKTCGEVERMSSWEIHMEFLKIRMDRIEDTARVHAEEVSRNGALPVGAKKKTKKTVGKAHKRGMRGI